MKISHHLAARLRESFGLRRGVVMITPADPAWAATYHHFVAELLPHLPDAVATVEHIGSTAVPGLAAKPILDVAVGLRGSVDPEETSAAMEGFGFTRRGDAPGPEVDRNFGFELEDRVRLVNAHLVRYGGREWTAYITFRDRLRADDGARDAYARIKRDLADDFPADRLAYISGKTAFILADGD